MIRGSIPGRKGTREEERRSEGREGIALALKPQGRGNEYRAKSPPDAKRETSEGGIGQMVEAPNVSRYEKGGKTGQG